MSVACSQEYTGHWRNLVSVFAISLDLGALMINLYGVRWHMEHGTLLTTGVGLLVHLEGSSTPSGRKDWGGFHDWMGLEHTISRIHFTFVFLGGARMQLFIAQIDGIGQFSTLGNSNYLDSYYGLDVVRLFSIPRSKP